MINRNLTTLEKALLFICGVTVFAYLVYVGAVKVLINKTSSVDAVIRSSQIKIQKDQKKLDQSRRLQKEYEQLMNQYKLAGSNEEIKAAIQTEIVGVANSLGLTITDLKPQRVKREEYFNRFSISVTLDSDFIDTINFLYVLQKEPHSFNVEEIRFDKGSRRRNAQIKTRLVKTRLVLGKIFIPND